MNNIIDYKKKLIIKLNNYNQVINGIQKQKKYIKKNKQKYYK